MVKGLGCLFTAAGCVGLGYFYRQQFYGRLQHIRILIFILDMMMSQVRYHKAMLPECFRQLAHRLEEPYQSVFTELFRTFEKDTGETFDIMFGHAMAECLERTPLGKEEKETFLEFAGNLGYEDAGLQLGSMEQYKERLKQLLGRLEGEVAGKGKMAMGLGVLGGLLLIVIFL